VSARLALLLASLLLALAVALGAFGAHALKARMGPELQTVWATAVQYHAWHALGLLGIGILMTVRPALGALALPAWLMIAGIVLFSGSLYALVLTGAKGLGAVTPLGGAAFIAAWLTLAWAVTKG
jgi:uncharacterized membrane protein YgdD (TMEM256/DUF423 family)